MQYVDVSGKRIKSTPVARGVVQVSVLELTLYSVYTCDLLNNIMYGSAHMYADDTQVLVHMPLDITIIKNTLINLMRTYQRLSNGLVRNGRKRMYILLVTRYLVEFIRATNLEIIIEDHVLSEHKIARNLGFFFDNRLTFKKYHVKKNVTAH